MITLLYILLAIVVLLFMVLVHELGHYIAGKALKFKITEFSIGFGKALFSHTSKSGETFSLRLFPLGGYCAFYGEDDGKENDPGAFNSQKPWKRIIVFLAGVTMNFITAIVFSWILLCAVGYDVPQIVAYSNQYNAGQYQVGDIVTHVGGKKVDFAFGENFATLINNEKSKAKAYYTGEGYDADTSAPYKFTMTVRRNEKAIDLDITVYEYEYQVTDEEGQVQTKVSYVVGLENDLVGTENGVDKVQCTKAYKYGLFEGLLRSIPMAFGFAWVVLKSLWMLITFQIPISQLGGTVATVATMAEYAQMNIVNMLIFIPLISANLAVFNLLPIPALDGAHVVFTAIEWARGKPINRELEAKIHFIGLICLLAFVVIVDVLHFLL